MRTHSRYTSRTPSMPRPAGNRPARASVGATASAPVAGILAAGAARRQRGFTTLELMVTVAIAAVMASIAAPGMLDFIRNNRLSAAARQLDADLLLARREAIKRNTRVLVCPVTTTAGACGAGATAWAQGWLVCYDADNDGSCDAAPSGTSDPNPIRTRGPVDSTLTLTGPASAARFNPNGSQGATGAATLTFTTRGQWSGSKSMVGSVSATGNVSLAAGS